MKSVYSAVRTGALN